MTIKVKRRKTKAVPTSSREPTVLPKAGRVLDLDHGGFFPVRPVERDVYIGIDPSLRGFTLTVSDNEKRLFAWRFTPAEKWPMVLRLMDIERFVQWKLQSIALSRLTVKTVAMENPAYGAEFGRETLGMVQLAAMRGLVVSLGQTNEAAYPYMVAPNSLKKFVTGKGSGPKDQISKFLFKRHGVDVPNVGGANDIADSIGLSLLAGALYRDDALIQAEIDVLKTIRQNTEWPRYLEHVLNTKKPASLSSG